MKDLNVGIEERIATRVAKDMIYNNFGMDKFDKVFNDLVDPMNTIPSEDVGKIKELVEVKIRDNDILNFQIKSKKLSEEFTLEEYESDDIRERWFYIHYEGISTKNNPKKVFGELTIIKKDRARIKLVNHHLTVLEYSALCVKILQVVPKDTIIEFF